MREYNTQSLFDLTGKTTLVTGSSKGIGKHIALVLASYGADIALIARNAKDLEEIVKEINAIGRKATYRAFDLTEIDSIQPMIKSIYEELGSIDILINNAGINIPKPAEEMTVLDWDYVMDINLKSVFFTTQAVGKYMKKQESGKIINVSSQMAFVGYYKRSAYSASKGGVTQLTKSLAIEWASSNINVNAIAPTFIETPMTKEMFKDEDFKRDVLNRIPLKRLAQKEDLSGAFVYLASEASNMVTGHTLVVDGGWTVW